MEVEAVSSSSTANDAAPSEFPGQELLWTPSNEWDAEVVAAFYRRRDRHVELDPVCTNITHYKRTGRSACFEFLCTLKNHQNIQKDRGRNFWLSYLDVQSSPSTREMLMKKGWRMSEHYSHYTDGEDIWDEDGDSHDESYRQRMARRGVPHKITTVAAAKRKPQKRPRTSS